MQQDTVYSTICSSFMFQQLQGYKYRLKFSYLYQMNKTYLLVLALIAVCIAQDLDSKRPLIKDAITPYSGVFAATWLGGFCFKSSRCDKQHLALWDKESFTIHGLWPSARTDEVYTDFDEDNIKDEDLYDDMINYWPPQSNSQKEFTWLWDHEYNKHGKDFAEILQTYNPKVYAKASSSKIQEKYFETVINFYLSQKLDKLKIQNAKPHTTTNSYGDLLVNKAQLSQIIGVHEENFITSCNKNTDYLQEIQICLRIQKNLEITLEKCKTIVSNKETPYATVDTCKGTFRLIGYKKPTDKNQERVTAYEK